jgi:hypothetical protein
MNEKLFVFSKIYCLNSFNLQLAFDEKTHNITMVGDKIDYMWLTNLINVLLSNLDMKLQESNIAKPKDVFLDQTNKNIVPILTSCKQRLKILKELVHTMSDLVGHSFYTFLKKNLISINDYSLQNIQIVLNEQLNTLKILGNKLTKTFPEYEDQLLQQKAIVEEERRLKERENELKLFRQYTETLQSTFDTNYTQNNLLHNLYIFKVITTGYVHILTDSMDFGAFSLRNITRTCIGFLASVPLGLVEGISYNLNDLVFAMINHLWLVLIVGFVVFRIFRKICKNFGL